MPHIITVASGKGGVGKSVLVSNLGLALAASGQRVVIADLDTGGADIATLFGEFNVPHSLGEFMSRKIDSLEDALLPVTGAASLRLLAGAGETLATANPAYATKQRVLRHLRDLPADIVIVDIGAGSGLNELDFFLTGDQQLTITTPDPTAMMDVYRFIKLAAIRKVVMTLSARDNLRRELAQRDFQSIAQIRTAVAEDNAAKAPLVDQVAAGFHPTLILNRADGGSRVNFHQITRLLKTYTGAELEVLGEIPRDEAIETSVREYLPVVKGYPNAPASVAITGVAKILANRLASQAANAGERWEEIVDLDSGRAVDGTHAAGEDGQD